MTENPTKQIDALPGGGYAATQFCEIDSPDPNALVLQFEAWESDASGMAPADFARDVLHVTIPVGMLAAGTLNLDAVIENGRADIRRHIENLRKGRAARSKIPGGERKDGARTVLAEEKTAGA